MKTQWTITGHIVTLCALCLSVAVVYNEPVWCKSARNQQVMKEESASEGALTDLRIRLFEVKKKLAAENIARQKLQIKLKEAEVLISLYETRVAGMFSGEVDEGKINKLLIKEFKALKKEAASTALQFDSLKAYVLDTYKLQKADETVFGKFEAKAALISDRLESMQVAGRSEDRKEGLVLDVNKQLAVVAISLGYSNGVTQGSEWQITEAGKVLASLKIVEVRKSLSLGVLTEGKLQDVLQGATVEKKIKIVK